MTAILYLGGLIIGATFFLYMLSLYNSGKERFSRGGAPARKKKAQVEAECRQTLVPPNVASIASVPPGERMCPLCRTTLTKYEPLYASPIRGDAGKKIMIHGCRYCYKDE